MYKEKQIKIRTERDSSENDTKVRQYIYIYKNPLKLQNQEANHFYFFVKLHYINEAAISFVYFISVIKIFSK